jgi:hypothetical protein
VYIDAFIDWGGVILIGSQAAAAVTSTRTHFRSINVSAEEHVLLEPPNI